MTNKYPIPPDALDDRLAITGTSGSGKTYAALGALSRLLGGGARAIGIDPLGVMYGLRLMADGKTASPYNVVIFGGPHGDLPINEHSGALIGETVATMRESCIVDLSQLGTKAAERRFMLAFLTALYRNTKGSPVHLVFDEADMWAPQKLLDKDGDAAKLLGMMETIVRRGRVKGFIPWLITQRPAVLSKDVLSQADGLVALKLTAKQDRDAIGGWIEGQADKEEGKAILAQLPTYSIGTGVVWIPGRGILNKNAAFPANKTFDSSRAPKRGEKRQTAALTPLDLGALKERLATVEAEAKASDPKALRAELAKLKAELAKAGKSVAAATTSAADHRQQQTAIAAARTEGYALAIAEVAALFAPAREAQKAARETANDAAVKLDHMDRILAKASRQRMAPKAAPPVAPAAATAPRASTSRASHGDTSGLTGPQRRVLASIGFWASVGTENPSRAQVGGVAGYSPSSGGFNNLLGQLNSAGLITIPMAGHIALADGAPFDPLTPDEAKAKVCSVISNSQRKLVDAALTHDGPMTRDELGAGTGYSASSGGFNNLIGSLCTLTIFEKPGPGFVSLSNWAREVLEA